MFAHEFLALWMPQGFEWVVIAVIALLLFGKRLPEVARSMGKGVVEFKKGLKGVQEEVREMEREAESQSNDEYEPPKSDTVESDASKTA